MNVPMEFPPMFDWDAFIQQTAAKTMSASVSNAAPVGDLPLFVGGIAATALGASAMLKAGMQPQLIVIDPMGLGRGSIR